MWFSNRNLCVLLMNTHHIRFEITLGTDCVKIPLHVDGHKLEILDDYECVKYCVFFGLLVPYYPDGDSLCPLLFVLKLWHPHFRDEKDHGEDA